MFAVSINASGNPIVSLAGLEGQACLRKLDVSRTVSFFLLLQRAEGELAERLRVLEASVLHDFFLLFLVKKNCDT